MPILGISDFRRLPRLGKIKLGKKDETKGNPYQTKYFVVPDEVVSVYGEEPTELDIMFPINNTADFFPQDYRKYGSTGLLCKGDGADATYMVEGQLTEKACTPNDPKCKGCKPVGILNVLLPKVNGFGVWQIWTSSWNSIVNLNSAVDMIMAMTGKKIAFIPLKLVLQEHSAVVRKGDKQFQKKVYVMSLNIDTTMGEFYNQYSLEGKAQRAINESSDFSHLVDVTNKFKMLNESKNETQFIIDDEDDEPFTEETDGVSTEEETRQYIKDMKSKLKLNNEELTEIFEKCNQDIYLVAEKLEQMSFGVEE